METFTATISKTVVGGIEKIVWESNHFVITKLSDVYGFDVEEACRYVGMPELSVAKKASKAPKAPKAPKAKLEKPAFHLPFVGKVFEDRCYGIKNNGCLFNQCMNAKKKDSDYCTTCSKNGGPKFGDIRSRMEVETLAFVANNEKKVVPYCTFMKKKGLSRAQVEEEAAKFGVEIPEEQFVARTRGRPKSGNSSGSSTPKRSSKGGAALDDDLKAAVLACADDDIASVASSSTTSSTKSKRGRPKLTAEEKAERAAKKAAEEAAKEAKRIAGEEAKAAKEAEKEAKRIAREEAKAAKEAAKEAKRIAREEAKAAKKTKKTTEEAVIEADKVTEALAKVEAAKALADAIVAPNTEEMVEEEFVDEEEPAEDSKYAYTEDDEGNTLKINKITNDVYYDETGDLFGKYNPKTAEVIPYDIGSDEELVSDDEE